MTADRVEVSWDPGKSKWLVRIQSGEEVIRRYYNAPKNADEQTLRAAADKTVPLPATKPRSRHPLSGTLDFAHLVLEHLDRFAVQTLGGSIDTR